MHLLITTSHSLILLDTQSQQWHRIHQGKGLYYGISHHNGLLYVAARNRLPSSPVAREDERCEILVFDANLRHCSTLAAPFPLRDIHEIAWNDDKLWVSCSYDNMVAVFDGSSWERWYPLELNSIDPTDVNHFNSFLFEDDEVWILAHNFGDSELFSFTLSTRALKQRIALGCCGHNIWREDGQILTCSSKEGKVLGQYGFMFETGGFPRGFAFDEHTRCVGISQLAELNERDFTTGRLMVCDQHWRMRHEIFLPKEGLILDLHPLPEGFRSAGSWSVFSSLSSMHNDVLQASSVFAIFKPEVLKRRFGSLNDGGYVVADLRAKDANPYDLYIGAGVGDNVDFDNEFIQAHDGIRAICFDGTLPGRPKSMLHAIGFVQKNISRSNSDQTTNLLSYIGDAKNIFLKMDIEGFEWGWLNDLPDSDLQKFKQIVLELHGTSGDGWGANLTVKTKVFEKIAKHFYIIHAHGNNYAHLNQMDKMYVPDVLELTLLRKDVPIVGLDQCVYPDRLLDSPNEAKSHDYEISSISSIHFFSWIQSRVIALGEEAVSAKDAKINVLNHALAQKDAVLREQADALAQNDAALHEQADTIASKEIFLNEAKQSLESQAQHLRNLDRDLHTHKIGINNLRQLLYGAPWYTHFYRGWKALVGNKQYNERRVLTLKRYSKLNVAWHTHIYRAVLGLFIKGEKPWHTHLYRAFIALLGNKKHASRGCIISVAAVSSPTAEEPRCAHSEKVDIFDSLRSRSSF